MTARLARLILVGCLGTPAIASGQSPWTVTPELANPVPIGACYRLGLVLLDPKTREAPRNPAGQRVTLADFDITVTAPDGKSVAAQWSDAFTVAACGCQGATPGSGATITMTYPAQELGRGAQVPGVAFQKVVPFTLAKPQGTYNPPECVSLASAPAPQIPSARVGSAATPPTSGAFPTLPTGTPYVPVVPLAVAQQPLAPLTVVVREEWTIPFQTAFTLPPGFCQIIKSYTNPNILITDHVIVTGHQYNQGANLRWTAEVANGSLHITVCNNPNSLLAPSADTHVNDKKINILVIR